MIRVVYLHGRARPKPQAWERGRPARMGLGDWVETWAKPIARWIDRLTHRLHRWASIKSAGISRPSGVSRPVGVSRLKCATPVASLRPDPLVLFARLLLKAGLRPTRLDGCSACSKRRRLFNTWLPDTRSFRAWLGFPGRVARSVPRLFRTPA